jgi:hypothetical protein
MLRRGGGQNEEGPERALGAQGAARRRLDRSHPFFWASFIQSGDWRSMGGK